MKNCITGSSIVAIQDGNTTYISSDTKLNYGSLARYKESKIFVINSTIIAFSGSFSDAQHIMKFLNIEQEKEDDVLGSRSIFKMLQRYLFHRRSNMDPLYVECVVGGDGFLGCTDHLGNFYESDVICTGMAANIATPL